MTAPDGDRVERPATAGGAWSLADDVDEPGGLVLTVSTVVVETGDAFEVALVLDAREAAQLVAALVRYTARRALRRVLPGG